jgi:hypothetical protein
MVFENLDNNMEIFHFCTGETIFFYDSLHRTGENIFIFQKLESQTKLFVNDEFIGKIGFAWKKQINFLSFLTFLMAKHIVGMLESFYRNSIWIILKNRKISF